MTKLLDKNTPHFEIHGSLLGMPWRSNIDSFRSQADSIIPGPGRGFSCSCVTVALCNSMQHYHFPRSSTGISMCRRITQERKPVRQAALSSCFLNHPVLTQILQLHFGITYNKYSWKSIHGLFSSSPKPLRHFQLHRSYKKRYFGCMQNKNQNQNQN